MHRRLVNITEICNNLGSAYCEALLHGFYVFTGEGTNCSFKGKGKITPLKKLEKNPEYQSSFVQLGTSWNVTERIYKELEEFTCLMYGYSHIGDKVRSLMFKKMVGEGETLKSSSKVDLAKLPPWVTITTG